VVTNPVTQETATEKTDQLKLSGANSSDQRADAKVSAAKEIEELQSRIQALQQNVKQLKESMGELSVESTTPSAVPLTPPAAPNVSPTSSTVSVPAKAAESAAVSSASTSDAKQGSASVWNDVSGFLLITFLRPLQR